MKHLYILIGTHWVMLSQTDDQLLVENADE